MFVRLFLSRINNLLFHKKFLYIEFKQFIFLYGFQTTFLKAAEKGNISVNLFKFFWVSAKLDIQRENKNSYKIYEIDLPSNLHLPFIMLNAPSIVFQLFFALYMPYMYRCTLYMQIWISQHVTLRHANIAVLSYHFLFFYLEVL